MPFDTDATLSALQLSIREEERRGDSAWNRADYPNALAHYAGGAQLAVAVAHLAMDSGRWTPRHAEQQERLRHRMEHTLGELQIRLSRRSR